jgi:ketosteroid isomerase-like protein
VATQTRGYTASKDQLLDRLARIEGQVRGVAKMVEDLIAFGTFADFVTGREAVEKQQWRNIWGTIDHFHCRLDDMRTIISADRLTAVAMIIFDSTGYNEDGAPYDRPGRATVVFGRATIGADWIAQHTHFSLCRGVNERSFGNRPEKT